jgi:hypothetical protein
VAIDRERARQYLKSFDFRSLFLDQLGWDKHAGSLEKVVDSRAYRFQAVSEKRGVVALVSDSIPDYSTRAKLDKLIAKDHFEHLIVFTDQAHGRQVWQWVRRESGKPNAIRAYMYYVGQPGELLLQKLEHLVVTLEEEEQTGLADILGRMRAGFDVEKVTKKFYERFKAEHDRFLKFVDGIPDKQMEAWYASVMINRLMFLYFIQAKSFLNGDQDYLRNKLKESRDRKKDGYYRDFLCPLFFEGFARKKEERSAAVNKLLGTVPYLNGGLFQRHQIEELHGKKIAIADIAFDHLFSFFREYDWHLDERENRDDREINPDVLGYIFEKYINDREAMGAYYTREDVTEYISKNTIVPFLLDVARKDCAVAFDTSSGVWRLLRDDPDRYIYDSLKCGANLPLPKEVSAGVADVKRRSDWNKLAQPECSASSVDGEPTETWREIVDRRRRYQEIRTQLINGEVHEVNTLVTLNLDVRQFAQDVIQYCEGPELLRALYKAISQVAVLDPTCGSGAFLFAALNILKPLYEACLQRMQMFVDELDAPGAAHHPNKFEDFKQILAESRQHPKQDYFILKSVIINNLYGVDIMEEAVEICKLRLFLKLVAQVDSQDRIEPLPDIDFNIRSGNTLVGYARYEDVEKAVGSKLDFESAMERIEDKALQLDSALAMFRQQQTKLNGAVTTEHKAELRRRFAELNGELDDYLSAQNGATKQEVSGWSKAHKPLHWFCEFHGVLARGGFDVIIGNPPYVEEVALRPGSPLKNLQTAACGDLYGYVFERALKIASEGSRLGLIVPISIFGTDGFKSLQDLLIASLDQCWAVSFANRPSQLFTGAQKRLTIVVGHRWPGPARFSTGGYLRWFKEERDRLMGSRIVYVQRDRVRKIFPASLEKLATPVECCAFEKMTSKRKVLEVSLVSSGGSPVYYTRKFGYFLAFLDFVPEITEIKLGRKVPPSELKSILLRTPAAAQATIAGLTSSTFFWFWNVLSDCRNLNRRDLLAFPLDVDGLPNEMRTELAKLGRQYLDALRSTSTTMTKSGLRIQTFSYATCKPIIDKIDGVLARHYGFSDEELDFIVNYDIKYRLGVDADEE